MKQKFRIVLPISFCLLVLCFPQISMQSVRKATSLWAISVVPALFPFSVAMTLLVLLRALDPLAKALQGVTRRVFGFDGQFAYLFLASACSGYPIGAKLTADLYAQHFVSKSQAEALLSCVSTSGPMFILGSVCLGMLGDARYALYLLVPHYLAAICICLAVGRRYAHMHPAAALSTRTFAASAAAESFGSLFAKAIDSCIKSMLLVCGFMILYSVYTDTIAHLLSLLSLPQAQCKAILGLMEMTTGCANSSFLSPSLRLIYLSFLISFGGFSIYSQTAAFAASAGLTLKHFLAHKSIQGILSAAFTLLLLNIIPLDASCFIAAPSALPLPGKAAVLQLLLPSALLLGARLLRSLASTTRS